MKVSFVGVFRSLRGFNLQVWVAGAFVSNGSIQVKRAAQD